MEKVNGRKKYWDVATEYGNLIGDTTERFFEREWQEQRHSTGINLMP